jgi:SAM-dependent methyltransferase
MLKRSLAAVLRRVRPDAVERFWSRAFAAGGIATWLAEPVVRRYVNACVSGSPDMWPMEWLAARCPGRFDRAVSLGCGDGALERDLRQKSLCRSVIGVDLSLGALAQAASQARAGGYSGIAYVRQDLDALVLPAGVFDAAFFHQALHHVEELESCLAEVARSLKPGGMLYLDEYVGPARSEWKRSLLQDAEAVFERLPRAVRRRRRLALPVDWRDPSEAVRSSEILAALEARFATELKRDYGGTFLSVIYPHLDFSRSSRGEREATLATVIDAERAYLQNGGRSYNTVVIARPRPA